MKIDNKIDKLFSRNVIFAAYIFLATSVFLFLTNPFNPGSWLVGGIFLLASLFVIFTSEHVTIDTEKNRVSHYYKIFGLIDNGSWKSLDNFRGVTLVPMRKIEGMASLSNQTTSTTHKDYRIFLVNKNKRPAFAIKTCKTIDEAQKSLDEFSIWLHKPVFSAKR
jgi:hypothetical protein